MDNNAVARDEAEPTATTTSNEAAPSYRYQPVLLDPEWTIINDNVVLTHACAASVQVWYVGGGSVLVSKDATEESRKYDAIEESHKYAVTLTFNTDGHALDFERKLREIEPTTAELEAEGLTCVAKFCFVEFVGDDKGDDNFIYAVCYARPERLGAQHQRFLAAGMRANADIGQAALMRHARTLAQYRYAEVLHPEVVHVGKSFLHELKSWAAARVVFLTPHGNKTLLKNTPFDATTEIYELAAVFAQADRVGAVETQLDELKWDTLANGELVAIFTEKKLAEDSRPLEYYCFLKGGPSLRSLVFQERMREAHAVSPTTEVATVCDRLSVLETDMIPAIFACTTRVVDYTAPEAPVVVKDGPASEDHEYAVVLYYRRSAVDADISTREPSLAEAEDRLLETGLRNVARFWYCEVRSATDITNPQGVYAVCFARPVHLRVYHQRFLDAATSVNVSDPDIGALMLASRSLAMEHFHRTAIARRYVVGVDFRTELFALSSKVVAVLSNGQIATTKAEPHDNSKHLYSLVVLLRSDGLDLCANGHRAFQRLRDAGIFGEPVAQFLEPVMPDEAATDAVDTDLGAHRMWCFRDGGNSLRSLYHQHRTEGRYPEQVAHVARINAARDAARPVEPTARDPIMVVIPENDRVAVGSYLFEKIRN